MTKLNHIDNFYFGNYLNRKGFWYSFKRSVNDIGNLYLLFRYLQVYQNRNWLKNQKEYSDILIKEKILVPTRSTENPSANSRGIKKVFEFLGFCYVDKDDKLQITSAGKKFLEQRNNEDLNKIKTNQLLKYQINNPLIKASTYRYLKIKPYPFLLELLSKLNNQSIDITEYKLFVCRAHSYKEFEIILNQIKEWRSLDEQQKYSIYKRVSSNEIFQNINAYASYSLSFFGKSSYTEISDLEDEKVLFLKKDSLEEVENILNTENIHDYNSSLDDPEKFIEYYGDYNFKEKSSVKNLFKKKIIERGLINKVSFTKVKYAEHIGKDKEKIAINQKVEDLFFLSGRTLNVLKKEQIIYLKDLLEWEEENLSKMQGMGKGSIDEIINQIKDFNKKNKTNLEFSKNDKLNVNITSVNKNLFKKLDEVDWSIRTMNVFKNEKLIFFGDLVQLSDFHLLRLPNFGKKSLDEVKNILSGMHLSLGQEIVWPPEDLTPKENLKILDDTKFEGLSDNDQINFFRSVKLTFDSTRVIDACLNSNIENLGDLHQNILSLEKFRNIGSKSLDEIKITLRKFISLPIGMKISNWDETKVQQFAKFNKKLLKHEETANIREFGKFDNLDDEINHLINKLNFKRQDIIDFHFGLDGSGLKTLQVTGDKFQLTRERIRQITANYLRIIQKRNIKGLVNLKRISDILSKLTPLSCINFEKYLIENKYVKKRFITQTILSLIELFLKSKEFILLEQKKIIDNKKILKYSKFKKFFRGSNINKFGLISINYVSKKFDLSINQISDLLKYEKDISILNNKWIYDTDKGRNRLYNLLQKIFNVNSKVNKFDIKKAMQRSRRIETPPIEGIISYCKKELNANFDGTDITIPNDKISKHFHNSSIKIISDIEIGIINSFKNDKILTYRQLVSRLIENGHNENSSNIYVSGNTPVLVKVYPGCYSLVGTKLLPGEAEQFYQKNKDKGDKIITEYDYNDDGSIWVGFEINKKTIDKRNFRISNSIYDVLKGNYIVKGQNREIKINEQKYISRLGNNLIKDNLKKGDDIIFTFYLNNRNVEIKIGENLIRDKFN